MFMETMKACAWEIGITIVACLLFVIYRDPRTFNSSWVAITWIVVVMLLLTMAVKKKRIATRPQAIIMLVLFSLLSLCCMSCAEKYVFSRVCLILMEVLFGAIILFAVLAIWKYKGSAITLKYSLQLFLGMLTVILGFAGVYMMLYYQYFPAGYDMLEHEREESCVLLAEDFWWYSVETLTGADISDVAIGNMTYEEFVANVNERGQSDYSEWDAVQRMLFSVRLIASIEALLFLFYISILVAGAGGELKES